MKNYKIFIIAYLIAWVIIGLSDYFFRNTPIDVIISGGLFGALWCSFVFAQSCEAICIFKAIRKPGVRRCKECKKGIVVYSHTYAGADKPMHVHKCNICGEVHCLENIHPTSEEKWY